MPLKGSSLSPKIFNELIGYFLFYMPGSYIPVSPKGGVFLEFSRNCFCNLQPHCFTIKAPEAMLEQWVGLNFKDNFGSSCL